MVVHQSQAVSYLVGEDVDKGVAAAAEVTAVAADSTRGDACMRAVVAVLRRKF